MSQPFFLSVRAIEDIIQYRKPGENHRLTNLNEIEVIYSANKYNPSCTFFEENDSSSLQEFKTERSNSDYSKISHRIEKSGSEGDYSIRNSLESIKFTGEVNSEADLRSWPSDSDITVLRMKKEYRNELLAKMDWEDERRLTDNSSHNLDWESHSLINLADVLKQKDQTEGLTPFTIWEKGNQPVETIVVGLPGNRSFFSNDLKDSKEVEIAENRLVKSLQEDSAVARVSQEQELAVVKVEVEAEPIDTPENKNREMVKCDPEKRQREDIISRPSKSKLIRGFFRSLIRCGSRRRESVDEIDTS